jgi:hypothetical protein
VLVIEEQTTEAIADPKTGKVTDKPVLVFEDTQTRLVLNVTNTDLVFEITGTSDTDDWPGHEIELYATQTNMAGRVVDCVRVRAPAPKKQGKTKPAAAPAPEPEDEVDFNAGAALADEEAATLKAASNVSSDLDDDIPY